MHSRDLTMKSKEEWAILDMVEIQAVKTSGEVEGSNEGSLISEQSPIDEIDCLRMFYNKVSDVIGTNSLSHLPSRCR